MFVLILPHSTSFLYLGIFYGVLLIAIGKLFMVLVVFVCLSFLTYAYPQSLTKFTAFHVPSSACEFSPQVYYKAILCLWVPGENSRLLRSAQGRGNLCWNSWDEVATLKVWPFSFQLYGRRQFMMYPTLKRLGELRVSIGPWGCNQLIQFRKCHQGKKCPTWLSGFLIWHWFWCSNLRPYGQCFDAFKNPLNIIYHF